MARTAPSALIMDQGRRVLLRIQGRQYELSQDELHILLGLPSGPPGLGITIDRNRFRFSSPPITRPWNCRPNSCTVASPGN